MSRQDVGRLGEALAKDGELRAKLEGAKDVDGMIAAARAAGYDFSAEELREALVQRAELTEDQLERVAGGGFHSSVGNLLLLPAVQKVNKILIGL